MADSTIATIADLKSYLDIQKSTDDAFLQRLLNSCTTFVERETGLRFEVTPAFVAGVDSAPPVTLPSIWVASYQTRLVPLRVSGDFAETPFTQSNVVTVSVPHARQITAVTVNDGATSVALESTNPAGPGYWAEFDSRLYTPYIRRIGLVNPGLTPMYNVQVTGRFGIIPPPDDVVDAVLALAARRYHERDASYGDQVQQPDGGLINYFRQLPPSVKATLDSYQEIAV